MCLTRFVSGQVSLNPSHNWQLTSGQFTSSDMTPPVEKSLDTRLVISYSCGHGFVRWQRGLGATLHPVLMCRPLNKCYFGDCVRSAELIYEGTCSAALWCSRTVLCWRERERKGGRERGRGRWHFPVSKCLQCCSSQLLPGTYGTAFSSALQGHTAVGMTSSPFHTLHIKE